MFAAKHKQVMGLWNSTKIVNLFWKTILDYNEDERVRCNHLLHMTAYFPFLCAPIVLLFQLMTVETILLK